MEDLQRALNASKQRYKGALDRLEAISNSVHEKRRKHIELPPRTPGVGAESCESTSDLPSINLGTCCCAWIKHCVAVRATWSTRRYGFGRQCSGVILSPGEQKCRHYRSTMSRVVSVQWSWVDHSFDERSFAKTAQSCRCESTANQEKNTLGLSVSMSLFLPLQLCLPQHCACNSVYLKSLNWLAGCCVLQVDITSVSFHFRSDFSLF